MGKTLTTQDFVADEERKLAGVVARVRRFVLKLPLENTVGNGVKAADVFFE